MNIKEDLDIRALSLIMALGCNLSCEYCHIAKSRHTHTKANEMQKQNIKALQDGSYLNNTLTALKRLNQDPEKIVNMSFWGQEPTLTLQYWTQNAKDWMEAYPNIEKFELSTNGMENPESIVEFCKAVDKYSTHHVTFSFQVSYDGENNTNNVRGANSKVITENVKYIIEELNKIKFKNLFIEMNFHAVISFDTVNKVYNDLDFLQNYYEELDTWGRTLQSYANNHYSLRVNPKISLNIENPYPASSEDGIHFYQFIKNSNKVDKTKLTYGNENPAIDIPGCIADGFRWIYQEGFDSVKEWCENLINNNNISDTAKGHLFCGNNVSELKMMYDGTLVNCQNYIFDMELSNIPEERNIENETKRSLINHHYFANALTDDEETLWKTITLFNELKNYGFQFLFQQILHTIYLLAKCNQIDQDYLTNKEKMFEHAFILAVTYNCAYNHLILTGSHYIKQTGHIREYCNGVLNISKEIEQNELIEFKPKKEKNNG